MSKQYGLIIPGQQKKAVPIAKPTAASIFDESSDSASDNDASAPSSMRLKAGVVSGPSVMERRVARNLQAKALAEDPTIFQYDELYDDMENKREEAKQTKSQEPRKPKYIGRLMEHAERRKLENELRIERQVQKEREAEGEKFKDKESYVTAAYREKLESIRQLQEKDQRDEYLEAIGDVTKQKDLDGFYRHLYEQKLGPKTNSSTEDVAPGYKPITKQRTYRKRQNSDDEESTKAKASTSPSRDSKDNPDQHIKSSSKAHLTNNIDADSDFSIDDTSDEEEEKEEKQKDEPQKDEPKHQKKKEDSNCKEKTDVEKSTAESINSSKEEDTPPISEAAPLPTPPVIVDRSLIWRKRTVDEVFDAAVMRYQERKRLRQG